MAPSNSGPRPVLMVVGLNAFHTICSQTFVAVFPSCVMYRVCTGSDAVQSKRQELNNLAEKIRELQDDLRAWQTDRELEDDDYKLLGFNAVC